MTGCWLPHRCLTARSASLWPFAARLLVAAFALNWAWELAQRLAYAEAAGRPLRESLHVAATWG